MMASEWKPINMSGAFTQVIGPAGPILGFLGSVIVIFSVMLYIMSKRRGGYASYQVLLWGVVLGSFMAAPSVLLKMMDTIMNWLVHVLVGSESGSDYPSATPSVTPSVTATPTPTPSVTQSPTPGVEVAPVTINSTLIVMGVLALIILLGILAVRGPVASSIAAKRAAAKAERDALRKAKSDWITLLTRYRSVNARFMAYDEDLDLVLRYPLMRDYRQDETKRVIAAMTACRGLDTPEPPAGVSDITKTKFYAAVDEFEKSLNVAEELAKRVFDTRMSEKERKALRQAEDLLAMVRNEASTEAERAVAYRALRKVLEGILVIHERTFLAIETKHVKAITASKAA